MVLEFLLRYYNTDKVGNAKALEMVNITLEHMAKGGIYDHLGGGFHRYSTDATWLIPHFEKMLYDNALISQLYTHAFQATNNNQYKKIATETTCRTTTLSPTKLLVGTATTERSRRWSRALELTGCSTDRTCR